MFATKDLLAANVHRLPILAMSSGMINGESLRRRLGLDLDDDGAAPDVLFDDGAATGVLFDVCSITKIHYNTTINSQNQFENNKCITFPSASSSLIRFSNASAFAIAGEGEPGTAASSSATSRKASLSASSCLARSLPFLFLDGDDLPVFFGGIASCVLDLNFFFRTGAEV